MATVAGGRYTLGDPSERGFLQWDTYGGARDRPTVAGEAVEPPSPDEATPTPPRPPLRRPVGAGVFSGGTPMAVLADRPTVAG